MVTCVYQVKRNLGALLTKENWVCFDEAVAKFILKAINDALHKFMMLQA